jgi:tRNA(Ile)-lysidine synthase
VDPQTLRDWLCHSGIKVVQDPSNDDVRFTRNRIRHGLLAAWRRDFPAYAQTLARSAAHAAQAQTLLDDLARIDLLSVGVPPSISALQALSPERQGNAIRHWLRNHHQAAPSQAQLETLLQQIAACTTRAHQIELKVGAGKVQRLRQHLQYTAPL